MWDIDKYPPSSSWLTPRQWMQYPQRLNRSAGQGLRIPGLPILDWQTRPNHRPLWACLGLDADNLEQAFGTENAVVAQVAEWIGRGVD